MSHDPRVVSAVSAVVFDYGGVLTTSVRASIASWVERDRIDLESFRRALRAWLSPSAGEDTPIHQLETGRLDPRQFEELLAEQLVHDDGSPVEPRGLIAALFAQMGPDPAMYALVDEVRACGVKVALLSNSWGNTYPRDRLDPLFDAVVISGEVGLRKPHEDAYAHTLGKLSVEPAAAVLVDDAQPNLDGAAHMGLRTILHHDAVHTRAALAEHVPGLDPGRSQPEGSTA